MAVLNTTSPRLSFGAPKLLPSKTVPSSRARIAAFNSDFPPVFSGRGVSLIEACCGERFNRRQRFGGRLLMRAVQKPALRIRDPEGATLHPVVRAPYNCSLVGR